MICLIEGLARVQATGCLSLLRVGVRYALCAGRALSDAFAEFRDANYTKNMCSGLTTFRFVFVLLSQRCNVPDHGGVTGCLVNGTYSGL